MVSDPDSAGDEVALPTTRASKPLLASEALMEDLAPEEPWRSGARWWCLLAGVVVLATTAPVWLSSAPVSAATPALVLGAIAILSGLIPVPYLVRGLLMLALGGTVVGLGAADLGPAAGIGTGLGFWWPAHTAAAFTLPAALLFRDRYRALPRARYLLGLSLVLSLPFVAHCIITVMTAALLGQITSGIALAAVIASLLGFMGADAPIPGSLLAASVIAAVTAQFGAAMVSAPMFGLADISIRAGAFLAAAVLGTLGVSHLLAAASYDHARSIDFRRARTERPQMPSLTSDSWTGRR